jgi:ribose-phosphate pyrophosphokinase
MEKLSQAPIDEVVVTDTIPLGDETKAHGNVRVLSVSAMLGEAIKRIHRDESVSSLFNHF